MPKETIAIALTFREDSSNTERDDDFAYLFTKLDELMQECSAFASYRVLTDEDKGNPFAPAQAGDNG
jgi:hypothetical protein